MRINSVAHVIYRQYIYIQQVCYVDYGNVEWISERNVRCIKEEYMILPFQAVHCRLAGVEKSKSHPEEAK